MWPFARGGDTWSADYDERGMSELVSCLRTAEPTAVLLEATGGLEVPLVSALAAAALPVVVVNPRQVRDFAKATGKLAKTDALDAQVLAHFAEAVRPPVRPLRDEDTQELNLYVVFDLQMCQFVRWVRGARVAQRVSQATALGCTVGSMTPLSPHLSLRTDTRARGPHLQVRRTSGMIHMEVGVCAPFHTL